MRERSVYRDSNGKTGERLVPVSGDLARIMVDQSVDGAIWTGDKGALTKYGVPQIVKRCMKRVGLTYKP